MIDVTQLVLADPVSLLAGGIATLLPSISAVGAKIIATVLILGGLIGAQLLLAPKPEETKAEPDKLKGTIKGEVTSEVNAIGRVRVGGVLVFGNTAGRNRFRLLGQCRGPVDAIENSYLGGQEIIVSAFSGVASAPWFGAVPTVENPASYIAIQNKPGDGAETAWPELLTDFPDQWTPAHRVRGIGQALTLYFAPVAEGDVNTGISNPHFAAIFQGGEPPLEQVIRAGLPYDPRTGTTHWTDNGILCALHVMLTWPEFSLEDFDLTFIAAQANDADEIIDAKSGSERRSRCSGLWLSETPRLDTMQQLLRSIGAELVPRPDNKLGIALTRDERPPEIALPARHLVELAWRSGPESVERPNLCVLKYYSPERQFEMAEIELQKFDEQGVFIGPAWARFQPEIDAYGEKPMTIELPFCPSAAQAQRIARQLFLASRSDTGIATYNWVGLAAWDRQMAALELPDGLGTMLAALGAARVRDAEGLVELPFVKWPQLAAWNVATDEVDAPDPLPEVSSQITITRPFAPHDASVSGGVTSVTVEQRGAVTNQLEVAYRTFDAATGLPSRWLPMASPIFGAGVVTGQASVARDLTGIVCEFRARQYRYSIVEGDPDTNPYVGYIDGYALSPFSAIYRTTPGAVPGAPAPPAFAASYDGASIAITLTAPAGALSLKCQGGRPLPVHAIECLPSQVFNWNEPAPPATMQDQVLTWEAQAFAGPAATGAGSPVVTASATIPGTG